MSSNKFFYLFTLCLFSFFLFLLFNTSASAGIPMIPINNECVNSTEAFDGLTPYETTDADTSMPPFSCGIGGGPDVWFHYTATCTGSLIVETSGEGYPSVVEVTGGTDCGLLDQNRLGCDDSDVILDESRFITGAQTGETFLIRVGGRDGATGAGELNINCNGNSPSNDSCPDAIEIFNGETPFSKASATTSRPPASCGTSTSDVWFEYEATCTGDVQFSLCDNADFSSTMVIYEDDECLNLRSMSCNIGACGEQSQFNTSVIQGSKYLVRIGTFGFEPGGEGVLTVTPQANCLPEPVVEPEPEPKCVFQRNQNNRIRITNGTPNRNVQIVRGFKKGNGTLQGTVCAGTELGILNAEKIAKIKLNSSGNKTGRFFMPQTSESQGYIQMVDLNTCTAGEVRDTIFTSGPAGRSVCSYDVPEAECPCFDGSAVKGIGIEFDRESRLDFPPVCVENPSELVEMSGIREDAQRPYSLAAGTNGPGNFCEYKDELHGIDIMFENIGKGQVELCQDIILNSSKWSTNCIGGT